MPPPLSSTLPARHLAAATNDARARGGCSLFQCKRPSRSAHSSDQFVRRFILICGCGTMCGMLYCMHKKGLCEKIRKRRQVDVAPDYPQEHYGGAAASLARPSTRAPSMNNESAAAAAASERMGSAKGDHQIDEVDHPPDAPPMSGRLKTAEGFRPRTTQSVRSHVAFGTTEYSSNDI